MGGKPEYWIIGTVLAIYFIVLIPIQYRNIAATAKEFKEKKRSHNEAYEKKSFEEEQLQFNLQGNIFNLPANIIAQLIYSFRHRDKRE